MSLSKQMDHDNTVLPTGLPALDEMLGGGLHAGSFNVIASRPGMGKTSFAMQIAGNIAAAGKSVYFCSLEMSKDGFNRIFRKQNGAIPMHETLYFDDHAKADVHYITGKTRSLAKCDAVFIDYLQLLVHDFDRATITDCIRALKVFARSANIPVIVTSQLPRPDTLPSFNEKETYHRPILSDLRSGVLTQDSDVIIFPFRESFHIEDTEINEKAELIVAKNRYGMRGSIPVHWDHEKMIVEEQDE